MIDPRAFLEYCIRKENEMPIEAANLNRKPITSQESNYDVSQFNENVQPTKLSNRQHTLSKDNTSNEMINGLVFTISYFCSRSNFQKGRVTQRMNFAGYNTIRNVYDCLNCFAKHVSVLDNQKILEYPSYIFLENTFYAESRPELLKIEEWWREAQRVDSDLFSFSYQTFDEKLINIPISLKTPYLVMHKGDCGHVFIFDEIRRFNAKVDTIFPLCLKLEPIVPPVCVCCEFYHPKFAIFGDFKEPYQGSLWCDSCYCGFFKPSANLQVFDYNFDTGFLDIKNGSVSK